MALCVRRRRGEGWHGALRGCCLIPLKFNKQLPGMKRDASVYLYKRERGREREAVCERKWERKGARRSYMNPNRGTRWEKEKGVRSAGCTSSRAHLRGNKGDAPRYTVFPINYVWSGRFVQRDARNPKNLLFAKFTGLDVGKRWQEPLFFCGFRAVGSEMKVRPDEIYNCALRWGRGLFFETSNGIIALIRNTIVQFRSMGEKKKYLDHL